MRFPPNLIALTVMLASLALAQQATAQTALFWTPSECVQVPPSGNPVADCPHVDDVRLTPDAPTVQDAFSLITRIGNNSTFQRKDSVYVFWSINGVPQPTMAQTLVESVVDPIAHFYEPSFPITPADAVGHVEFTIEVIDLIFNAEGALRRTDTVISDSGSFNIVPPAPADLTAAGAPGGVDLAWQPAAGASTYTVYRTDTPTQPEALSDADILASGVPDTSFLDASAAPGTAYYYRVVAAGEGTRSDGSVLAIAGPVSVEIAGTAGEGLNAPQLLSATVLGQDVALEWTAVAAAGAYRVYRDGVPVADVAATVYADQGLPAGNYTYTVTALAGDRESPPSNALSVDVDGPPLPAPVLAAAEAGDREVTVRWFRSEGADLYALFRDGAPIAETADTVFTDAGLQNGVAYTYEVVARAGGRESEPSNALAATPVAIPPTIAFTQYAPRDPSSADSVAVVAGVTDPDGNLVADSVQVVWWLNGLAQPPLPMQPAGAASFDGFIPPQAAGDTVAFSVRAVDAKGNSAAGDTLGYRVAAPRPVRLTAEVDTLSPAVALAWTPGGQGPYTLYRTDAATEAGALTLADTLATSLADSAFVDTDVTRPDTLFYRVQTADGTFSNEVRALVPDDNRPPFQRVVLPDTTLALDGAPYTVALDTVFVDPDGDLLTFTASAAGPAVSVRVDPVTGILTVSPEQADTARVTVSAGDGIHPPVTASFLVTVVADTIAAPVLLSAEAGDARVDLTWTDVAGADSFTVYRNDRPVATVADTTYRDAGLANGVTYRYAVTARAGALESRRSNSLSATPQAPAPIDLVANLDAQEPSATLRWTPGTAPYTLYRTQTPADTSALTRADTLATGIADTLFVDVELVRGATYFYRVRDDAGAFSDEEFVRVPDFPGIPDSLAARPGDGEVALTWKPAAWAEGYTLYRTPGIESDTLIVPALNETAYVDRTVTNDTLYTYWVEAVNFLGVSNPSDPAPATPEAIPPVIEAIDFAPAPPKASERVQVTAVITDDDNNIDPSDPRAVAIVWTVNGVAMDSLFMTRRLEDTYAGTVPPQAAGDSIVFSVVARDARGNTARSGERGYRVLTEEEFRLSIVPRSRRLVLNWEPASTGDAYRLLRADSPEALADPASRVVVAEGITDTTYVDEPLVNGQVYVYQVLALEGTATVGRSNVASEQPGIPVTPSFSPAIPNAQTRVFVAGTFTGEQEDLDDITTVQLLWRRNGADQEPVPMAAATTAELAMLGLAPAVHTVAAARETYVATLPPQSELDEIVFFLTASDAAGELLAESESRRFTVNARPVLCGEGLPDVEMALGDAPRTYALDEVFCDADGDPLRFAVAVPAEPVASATIDAGVLTLAPLQPGLVDIVVTAADDFSGAAADTLALTVTTPAGGLYVEVAQATALRGEPYPIDAQIVDQQGAPAPGKFIVDAVTLRYRRGGDTDFTVAAMTPAGGDDRYRFEIPATALTERGLEYAIVAEGRSTLVGFDGPSDVQAVSVRVRVDGLRTREALPPLGYRIVSFPLELDDDTPAAHLIDDFEGYDPKNWRFLAASQPPGGDTTLTNFRQIESLEAGRGYWLITRNGAPFFDMGGGLTNPLVEAHEIDVPAGWSLIGSPYAFALPVGNLSLASGRPIRDVRDYTQPVADSLRPFQGYAIYVDEADVLQFDPDVEALPPVPSTALRDSSSWQLTIAARSGDLEDRSAAALVSDDALPAWDALDRPTPPAMGDHVAVRFVHPRMPGQPNRYRVDARPATDDGEVWTFEVAATTGLPVELSVENVAAVPDGYGAWLVDPALGTTVDLRETPAYSLASASADAPRLLTLVVGSPAFLAAQTGPADLPTAFSLDPGFPNPFRGATTLPFSLPEPARVTLDVYDTLGKRVAVVLGGDEQPAGRHSAIWDGRNMAGQPVASGLYIVRFQAGAHTATRTMVRVR